MNNLSYYPDQRKRYVNYLCRKWEVVSIELYYVNKDTNRWGESESTPKEDYLFTKRCLSY